jgi:hypothetical protein
MKSGFRRILFLGLGLAAAALLLAAPVNARPPYQDPTPYEFPTDEYETPGYPSTDLTPYVEPGQPSPTSPGGVSITPGPSPTLGTPEPGTTPTSLMTLSPSPTVGRNLFGTEDAEMGAARVTPPPSETPSPSETPTATITATPTQEEPGAFDINSSWFAAGILLPPVLLLTFWLINRARRSGEFG